MKKKIFAVIASMAIAASMSTGVFASGNIPSSNAFASGKTPGGTSGFGFGVAPGATDGFATGGGAHVSTSGSSKPSVPTETAESKVEADKPVELKTDNGVTLDAPAGTFNEGDEVKIETAVDKAPADATKTAASIAGAVAKKLNVAADSADAKVVVNTKISIDLYVNNAKANPNGSVTVTVAHDGKSNYAAYIGSDGKVELLKLTVDGANASFDTTHFSDYYFVTISEKAASAVGDSATLEAGTPAPGSSSDKNAPTGVAIALTPVILSGAFGTVVAILKKKKD